MPSRRGSNFVKAANVDLTERMDVNIIYSATMETNYNINLNTSFLLLTPLQSFCTSGIKR